MRKLRAESASADLAARRADKAGSTARGGGHSDRPIVLLGSPKGSLRCVVAAVVSGEAIRAGNKFAIRVAMGNQDSSCGLSAFNGIADVQRSFLFLM